MTLNNAVNDALPNRPVPLGGTLNICMPPCYLDPASFRLTLDDASLLVKAVSAGLRLLLRAFAEGSLSLNGGVLWGFA
ncbi:hypothetical protein ES703_112005 [subsurface metagenome]